MALVDNDGTETQRPDESAAIPLIELRAIKRTYITGGGVEVQALRGVDLKIYPGEFVAIMGQSGSGKSTLMNIIGCLDRPTSGRYLFAGRDIQSFDADGLAWLRREAFGFIFQSYNLLQNQTAAENVEVPAIYAGLSAGARKDRAESLLASLGLGARLDHRPTQLSGGQQQRVSIARALMNGGNVILADEPTGALDSRSGVEVIGLLEGLARKGHTVILITHDAEVAKHADRVVEFFDGSIARDSGYAPDAIDARKNAGLLDLFRLRKASHFLAGEAEAVRMALRSLYANMFRTFLTLLGIVIGVASVVAMLAIGEGSQQEIVERIGSIGGTNMLNLQPARREGQFRGMQSSLTFEDADAILEGVPNVRYTLPELQGSYTVRFGHYDHSTQITATSESLPEARSWKLARGVFFTRADSDRYTAVAVLGATVAEQLFPDGQNPLGEFVLIGTVPFEVIGVMTRKGGSSGFGGGDQDDAVFIPLKTGGLRLFGQDRARSIAVTVTDLTQIDQTERDLIAFMTERHGQEDIRIFNAAEMLETVSATIETTTLFLSSIAAISLLVGGIGVMNIMLVSVTERTREIGIRMATGARQKDILAQFLSEAIVVSGIGGIVGVLLGIGVGQIVGSFGVSVVFSSKPMVLAFTCAAATGLIFGFAPARKAAQLDPIVALANE
ncbi:MAG: MacB family efflux pump subunit [Gammaproteobacteria bacterium]|nr:MacB family efflux pump subunit [Gammaproteobacteria bacterium]